MIIKDLPGPLPYNGSTVAINLKEFEDVAKRMKAAVSEQMFGYGPEQRVYDLRRSVLGDAAGPGPSSVAGLSKNLNYPSYSGTFEMVPDA